MQFEIVIWSKYDMSRYPDCVLRWTSKECTFPNASPWPLSSFLCLHITTIYSRSFVTSEFEEEAASICSNAGIAAAGIAEMDLTSRFTFPETPSAQILICLMSANVLAVRH